MDRRTSILDNSLIWFGAGVSIAEILTGTYFSALGFRTGLLAILIGHIIGCTFLFFAGYIGACSRQSAMETTKRSFGAKGGLFFALCNLLQLVGWTAIMIYDGALSANTAVSLHPAIWCLLIGVLICVWIHIGIERLGTVNRITMSLLFLLTLILCRLIFKNFDSVDMRIDDALSFGAAVELAAAMPLSWIPLISDYTRKAEKPLAATLTSALTYGLVSCWMYTIGMGAAIFTSESDIALIMVKAGLGIIGLLIIVLSTVTTTFMDAYSAGISAESLSARLEGKKTAVLVAIIGTICAMLFPMDDITGFLYLIGSVFAPMIGIMIADFFLLHQDSQGKPFQWCNLLLWLFGFLLYRFLMHIDLVCGNTLPDILIMIIMTYVVRTISINHIK